MGLYAYLEVDNGEWMPIQFEGINMGTPLAAFLETYGSSILRGEGSREYLWFKQFEENLKLHPRILTQIYYGEDMLFSPDEFEKFLAAWGSIYGDVNEVEFKKALEDVDKKWTPIIDIIPVVEEIVRFLPQMGGDTHWYNAVHTQPAFQGLLNTLKQAHSNNGNMVRILLR